MRCHTCECEVEQLRSVKLRQIPFNIRPDVTTEPPDIKLPVPGSPAWDHWRNQYGLRRSFICEDCYQRFNNPADLWKCVQEIGGKVWSMRGESMRQRAAVYNQRKYDQFQSREAAKLGIALTT